jgi:predicted HicB family RNase H-like nuclease
MASQGKFSEVFPLRVTARMYRDIKKAAEREYLTISQYVRKVLREALEGK